jgi:hypothetical protein
VSADLQPRDDGWSMQEAIDDLDLRMAVLCAKLDLLTARLDALTGRMDTAARDSDTPH